MTCPVAAVSRRSVAACYFGSEGALLQNKERGRKDKTMSFLLKRKCVNITRRAESQKGSSRLTPAAAMPIRARKRMVFIILKVRKVWICDQKDQQASVIPDPAAYAGGTSSPTRQRLGWK